MTMSTSNPNFIEFDPRFLVFEFTYSILLRKSQVILVNKFMDSLRNNQSMCHQMIMGAGKTTVSQFMLNAWRDDESLVVAHITNPSVRTASQFLRLILAHFGEEAAQYMAYHSPLHVFSQRGCRGGARS